MYEEHPSFTSIAESDKIWRYMDFTKFISLLENEKMFFPRADLFNDKFEGTYPKSHQRAKVTEASSLNQEEYEELLKLMVNSSIHFRKTMYINCWHINEFESEAMWKIYSSTNNSVVIQSTFENLKQAFCNESHSIYIGKVNYIDYNTELIDMSNGFTPYLYKRKSFEYERELRAVISQFPSMQEGDSLFDLDIKKFSDGINVPIDLFTLIEKIYISPIADEWFKELVIQIVKRYNLRKEVIQSELAQWPLTFLE